MSQKQQILDKQLQNYYYDGHSVRQFQQVQHSQVQNSEQRQIYAQQINNPTQQIFQQQIQQTQQTPNIDQEIIPFDNSLSIIATSPPFQKVTGINNNNDMLSAQSLPQQPHQLVYVKSSSHTSSSPSTNNDISNNCHQYNRDLNLNVSTLNLYPKDKRKGEISSHYLIQKAQDFVASRLYKQSLVVKMG
ncbi:11313_t:CDS:2 [Entrophospora sp. SA101]|nr:11313_t:CDS:2 [Entrophospora sp. SA101]